MSSVSKETWLLITYFGSAGTALSLALMLAFGLWLDNWKRVAICWMAALAGGVAIAASTVIAFAGWGVGIAVLDFTGISGHALLACAVLPVVLACLFSAHACLQAWHGLVVGLLLGMLIGWSRIVLGAHSWSEVVMGCCLGAAISGVAWQAMGMQCARLPPLKWTTRLMVAYIVLLLSMPQAMSMAIPAQKWATWFALFVSGQDQPHTRADLHSDGGR